MSNTAPSLQDQADFLWNLQRRCIMRDGSLAGETLLVLTAADVEVLDGLRERLNRMAPHESEIKRIVTRGRRG